MESACFIQGGEKVFYSVQYGVINGGIASLELDYDSLKGKEVWHSKITSKNNRDG